MYPILIVAVIIALDQITKYLAVSKLIPGGDFSVIKGILEFTYVENYGIAFGMFSGKKIFFVIAACLIAIAIVYAIVVMYRKSTPITICLSLILAGAIGNLIDRIRLGFVVDFVHFSFFPPVFNIADSAVVVGAIALSLLILFYKEA